MQNVKRNILKEENVGSLRLHWKDYIKVVEHVTLDHLPPNDV